MGSLVGALYRSILRPLLFQIDPERSHHIVLRSLAFLPSFQLRDDPRLHTRVLGIDFSNPVGLAAGMDKDGRAIGAWRSLGFGLAEIGTITPRAQSGNPPPRIWRLPEQGALINRLGFPSDGVETVVRRIAAMRNGRMPILAINLGPNKETTRERIAEDYATLTRRVAQLADFLVINVSSPNTPGLRDAQAPQLLRAVITAVKSALPADRRTPIAIKIAPDLLPDTLDQLAEAALTMGVDAIVATNTTTQRAAVGVDSTITGGLSGRPLRDLSRSIIAHLYRNLGGRIPIIGVGGIATADDAYEHIRAGANLVELYTGLIYEGPTIASSIKRGLIRLLERDGLRSIAEAVGVSAANPLH